MLSIFTVFDVGFRLQQEDQQGGQTRPPPQSSMQSPLCCTHNGLPTNAERGYFAFPCAEGNAGLLLLHPRSHTSAQLLGTDLCTTFNAPAGVPTCCIPVGPLLPEERASANSTGTQDQDAAFCVGMPHDREQMGRAGGNYLHNPALLNRAYAC